MNEIKELKYWNTRCYCINDKVLIDTDWAGTLPAFFKCTKENKIELKEIECLVITHFHPDHMGIAQEIADLGIQLIVFEEQKDFVHCSDNIFAKDKSIQFIYEDNVLGKISDDRFYRMSANYEKEQKELLTAVEHDEQELRKTEQEKIDLKIFLEAIRECIDLKELTPTIVNTLIKRIDVHNSIKGYDGLKHVPIDIYFTAVGIINIPTEKELLQAMEEMREKPLKTA